MKTLITVKKSFLENLEITSDRGLVLKLYEATMNLAPVGILHIFGYQYIIVRVLSCSVILR